MQDNFKVGIAKALIRSIKELLNLSEEVARSLEEMQVEWRFLEPDELARVLKLDNEIRGLQSQLSTSVPFPVLDCRFEGLDEDQPVYRKGFTEMRMEDSTLGAGFGDRRWRTRLEGHLQALQAIVNVATTTLAIEGPPDIEIRPASDAHAESPAFPAERTNAPRPVSLARPLTPVQLEILEVLRASVHRLTTKEIMTAMAGNGRIRNESTVKGYLAQMVQSGLLDNRQDENPKGYWLVSDSSS